MELTEFTGDVEVIQKLGTFPNAEDGLTAEDLKKKFDEAPVAIKKYLNETLVPEVNRIGKNAGKPISVTITTADGALTADKGYAELYAAHVAGQTVHCKLPDGSVLALATADENGLLFQGENGRDYQQIIIGADGTITYKSGKYALQSALVTDALIGVYPSGDGYESTDTLEDLQESAKAGRTIVCNLEVGDGELLRLPMTKREDDAFHFSAVFEGKEYLVTINADGVTVEISECGGGNSGGNIDQSGLSTTAKNLLITILRNGVYSNDQSANITALENALASGDSGSGDTGDTETVTYTITNKLTNCSNSNTAATIAQNSSYTAVITADDGYELDSVVVTMGGVAVAVTDGVINISSVTGNIVITATAVEVSAGGVDWVSGAEVAYTLVDGEYVDDDGSFGSNDKYSRTDYIYCYGAGHIYHSVSGSSSIDVMFYDINKNLIYADGGYDPYNAVPENAAYVVMSHLTEVMTGGVIKLYKKVEPTWTDGEPYAFAFVENEYINTGTGEPVTYSGWKRTDYVNCVGVTKITKTNASANSQYGCFYNAEKEILIGMTTPATTDGAKDITIPVGACYFRTSDSNANMDALVLVPHA